MDPAATHSRRIFSDRPMATFQLRGLNATIRRLAELNQEMPAAAREELKLLADHIAEGAIKRAPVDTANLEESIYAQKVSDSRYRVIVDPETTDTRHGKSHDPDYHVRMHEGIYALGPKSLAKQRSQPERVGRHYLRRAFDHSKRNADKRIKERLRLIAAQASSKRARSTN
jgi:hypothetical protein